MLRSSPGIALSFAALTTALLLSPPALAAEKAKVEEKPAPASTTQIGLGVSLGAGELGSPANTLQTPVALYVPINFGVLRVEPSLGIGYQSVDTADSSRIIAIGVGAFYVERLSRDFDAYGGGRLALLFESSTPANQSAISGTGVRIAGAAGAEWLPSPHFALGAEAQLAYMHWPELSQNGAVVRHSISAFNTLGLLFFRIYL
jgi:hypothetical protein